MTQNDTKNNILTRLYSENDDFLFPDESRRYSTELLKKTKLPDKKTENWQKFQTDKIFKHKYKLGKPVNVDKNEINSLSFFNPEGNYVILVNGFVVDVVISKNISENFFAGSLKNTPKKYKDILSGYLSRKNKKHENYFSILNDAFVKDGTFIYIPENTLIDEPVYIMHLIQSDDGNIFSQNRNLILAGKNSSCKIVHTFHSLSADFSLNNTVTDIFINENANLEYYLFEGEGNTSAQVNNVFINSEKNGKFKSNVVTLCGSPVRNNFIAEFKGEYAEADLQGIYMPDKEQNIDNFVEIIHAKPNCKSNQLFKGIIDNKAVSVFTGKVFVAKDAQKTDSAQSNQNILLTDYARAHSRPQLEIYADDVACSHGSTTGQLDKEALFYMKTRGIPEKRAKTILMKAFLRDITDKINVSEYREYVNFLINKRLKGQSPESLCSVKVCPSCS